MNTKRTGCSQCSPDGGAILDKAEAEDGRKVWECRNCQHQTPRRHWVTKERQAKLERYERLMLELCGDKGGRS